jgi:hypothetical protein
MKSRWVSEVADENDVLRLPSIYVRVVALQRGGRRGHILDAPLLGRVRTSWSLRYFKD